MSKRYLFTCSYDSSMGTKETANEDPINLKTKQDSGNPSQSKSNCNDQDVLSKAQPSSNESHYQPVKTPLHQESQDNVHHSHNLRENGQQHSVKSKKQHCPVERVPPKQSQQGAWHGNNEQSSESKTARMLIFLQNGEERLITFMLPKESCTLQEVLEKVAKAEFLNPTVEPFHINFHNGTPWPAKEMMVKVPFSEYTQIQCMRNPDSKIDYFVAVGVTKKIEDMVENHPLVLDYINKRTSPTLLTPHRSGDAPCPENLSDGESDTAKKKIKLGAVDYAREIKLEAFKHLINDLPEEKLEDCWNEVIEVMNKYSN